MNFFVILACLAPLILSQSTTQCNPACQTGQACCNECGTPTCTTLTASGSCPVAFCPAERPCGSITCVGKICCNPNTPNPTCVSMGQMCTAPQNACPTTCVSPDVCCDRCGTSYCANVTATNGHCPIFGCPMETQCGSITCVGKRCCNPNTPTPACVSTGEMCMAPVNSCPTTCASPAVCCDRCGTSYCANASSLLSNGQCPVFPCPMQPTQCGSATCGSSQVCCDRCGTSYCADSTSLNNGQCPIFNCPMETQCGHITCVGQICCNPNTPSPSCVDMGQMCTAPSNPCNPACASPSVCCGGCGSSYCTNLTSATNFQCPVLECPRFTPCGSITCVGQDYICCNADTNPSCVGMGQMCPAPSSTSTTTTTRPIRRCGNSLCGLKQRCCNPGCANARCIGQNSECPALCMGTTTPPPSTVAPGAHCNATLTCGSGYSCCPGAGCANARCIGMHTACSELCEAP